MTFIRLFFIFMIGLFIRRLWRSAKNNSNQAKPSESGGKSRSSHASGEQKPAPGLLSDITEQEIDDADFEEIP